jgi:hypothetical protein
MNRRSRGIVAMPAIYFGLIIATAALVVADLVPEIPAWSLPIFAVLAVAGGMRAGSVRLLDVVLTFIVVILIFPIGVLYLIGITGNLTTTQTLSIIAMESGVSGWLMILSPVAAAIVTCLAVEKLLKS